MRTVFEFLKQHHLCVKISKREFAASKIEYFGHVISAKGMEMNKQKIVSIEEWPRPNNINELKGFFALTGYYRRFIKG